MNRCYTPLRNSIASAFGPHFPLTVWADISLTALETLGFFVTTSLCTAKLQLRTKSEPFLLTFFAVWLLSFSILALLLLKVLAQGGVGRERRRPVDKREREEEPLAREEAEP
ncbi:hypothetical protein NMY22_g4038 [Coprinellus aureogranulatus]|nr:hypothetical protein NMY22_g4038 [Coprinellus aureogranulatus]